MSHPRTGKYLKIFSYNGNVIKEDTIVTYDFKGAHSFSVHESW